MPTFLTLLWLCFPEILRAQERLEVVSENREEAGFEDWSLTFCLTGTNNPHSFCFILLFETGSHYIDFDDMELIM